MKIYDSNGYLSGTQIQQFLNERGNYTVLSVGDDYVDIRTNGVLKLTKVVNADLSVIQWVIGPQ